MFQKPVVDWIVERWQQSRANQAPTPVTLLAKASTHGFRYLEDHAPSNETVRLQHVDHNRTQSSLYMLPTEVLRMILTVWLPTYDKAMHIKLGFSPPKGNVAAASMVCQKFRDIIGPLPASHERRDTEGLDDAPPSLASIIQAAKYRACICPYEEASLSKTKSLACSGCHSTHRRDLFDSTEISKPATQRLCRGRKGTFKMCEHLSVTFNEVEHLLSMRRPNPVRRFTCTDPAHRRSSRLPRLERADGRLAFLVRHAVLVDSDDNLHLGAEHMVSLLEALDVFICPHLRSSSFRITSSVRWNAQNGDFSLANRICSVDNCSTFFNLNNNWDLSPVGVVVELVIRRTVGEACADNLAWIAQLCLEDSKSVSL